MGDEKSNKTKTLASHHRIANGDGQNISVYEKTPQSEKEEPRTILLIHSATYSSIPEYDLDVDGYSLMGFLATQGVHVYAVDIRGYGNSDRPTPEVWVSAEIAVRDVHTAVNFIKQRTGISSIDILGWSWGTQIAGLFAQQCPDFVDRLILYAPFWRGINADTPEPKDTRQKNTPDGAISDFLDTSKVDPVVLEKFAERCMQVDSTSPIGSWRDLRRLREKPIIDPREITASTLIIYGDRDHLVIKSDIDEFYDVLPNRDKEMVVISGADHMAHLELNHHHFNQAIIAFLSGKTKRPLCSTSADRVCMIG